jgi:hypothetical protein
MPTETRYYTPKIPAGTLVTAPAVITLDMPARIVTGLRWRVPPGPFGLMGWALASAGIPIVPFNTGGWIIADDEWDDIPLDTGITSGAWQLMGYNNGANDHTIYLTFHCRIIDGAMAGPTGPLLITPSTVTIQAQSVAASPDIIAPGY